MTRGSDLGLLCLRATYLKLGYGHGLQYGKPQIVANLSGSLVRNTSINDLEFDVMRVGSLIECIDV